MTPADVVAYRPSAFAHIELAAMRRRLGTLSARASREDHARREAALDRRDTVAAHDSTVAYSQWHRDRTRVEDFCTAAYRGRIDATVRDCWTAINGLADALDDLCR